MALLSAIISLLSRKVGDLLQAIFGWSIVGLFGRLPDKKKQTGLSVALILSLAWPFLLAGIGAPRVAAWAVAFVPPHEFVGTGALRVVWLVLAILAPIGVAVLTRWVAPPEQKKGGLKAVLVSSVPLTIGFAVSFLVTFVIVPTLKLAAMARRWRDDHVYVLIDRGAYHDLLDAVRAACTTAEIALEERPMPKAMALPLNVLKWFARGALAPIVAEDPRMLYSKDLAIYLFPGDLLLRGAPAKLARVRCLLVMQLVNASAHLVEEPVGQRIEDELHWLWTWAEGRQATRAPGAVERRRLRVVSQQLARADLPLDQWSLLHINLDLLKRALSLAPDTEDAAAPTGPRTARYARARSHEEAEPSARP
jgi:hypothetical protein